MEPKNSDHAELEYHHSGMKFVIRAHATRGDQYEMNATMAEGADIQDGKVIKAHAARLFPWLIERFVIGCDGISGNGKDILAGLMKQPATPGEDLILVLGSYILNHTGIVPMPDAEEKKKA